MENKTVLRMEFVVVKNDDSEITKDEMIEYVDKMTGYSDSIGFQFGGQMGLLTEQENEDRDNKEFSLMTAAVEKAIAECEAANEN